MQSHEAHVYNNLLVNGRTVYHYDVLLWIAAEAGDLNAYSCLVVRSARHFQLERQKPTGVISRILKNAARERTGIIGAYLIIWNHEDLQNKYVGNPREYHAIQRNLSFHVRKD